MSVRSYIAFQILIVFSSKIYLLWNDGLHWAHQNWIFLRVIFGRSALIRLAQADNEVLYLFSLNEILIVKPNNIFGRISFSIYIAEDIRHNGLQVRVGLFITLPDLIELYFAFICLTVSEDRADYELINIPVVEHI